MAQVAAQKNAQASNNKNNQHNNNKNTKNNNNTGNEEKEEKKNEFDDEREKNIKRMMNFVSDINTKKTQLDHKAIVKEINSALNEAIKNGNIYLVEYLCGQPFESEKLIITEPVIGLCVENDRLFILKLLFKLLLDREETINDWDSFQGVTKKHKLLNSKFVQKLIDSVNTPNNKNKNNNSTNRCCNFLQNLLKYGFDACDYKFISLVLNHKLHNIVIGNNGKNNLNIPNMTVRVGTGINVKANSDCTNSQEHKVDFEEKRLMLLILPLDNYIQIGILIWFSRGKYDHQYNLGHMGVMIVVYIY